MNTFINSFLFLSFFSICACSSIDDASDVDNNEKVFVVASMAGSVTKVNDKGDAFNANDKFHLYNTAYTPNKDALESQGRYATYKYVDAKSCTPSESDKGLVWGKIMRDGNQFFFTATTEPEISSVKTDQTTLDLLKESDFLVARKVVKVAEKWKPVHLKFHHVLCQVNIEVKVPRGDFDFPKDALTEAKLVKRQTAFSVTYGPTHIDEDKGIETTGIGDYANDITMYEVSRKESSGYQVYVYRAIIPNQETKQGVPFARFKINSKWYTYSSTNNVSNGTPFSLKQGHTAYIKLSITKSNDIPIVLEPVKLLPWKGVRADMGELEPTPIP